IEPRPQLAQHLRGRTEPDFADILLESVLIPNREGDRIVWTAASHATRLKLLYLARLREHTPLASAPDAERVLGSARVSATLFDRWWTIRRREVENDREELVCSLRPVQGKIDPPDDELVAAWLQAVWESALRNRCSGPRPYQAVARVDGRQGPRPRAAD